MAGRTGPAQPGSSLADAQNWARAAHRRGLQAGSAFRPAVATRHLRAGLLVLGWHEEHNQPDTDVLPPAHHALAARLLMSLAHYEAEQGRTDYGLRLLDRAESLVVAADRGILLSQRGLVYVRTWRDTEALRLFDQAVPLLQDYPDPAYLARTLLNRGVAHLNLGNVRRARADLACCQRVSASHGLDLMAAKAIHNQGYCALLAGDLPAALRLYTVAADRYRLSAPGILPVLALDKARTLLAAGLVNEAAAELDDAITSFRRQRLAQDLAEAELTRAQAALAAGDLAAARRWAAGARQRFLHRGNHACAYLAELIQLRARAVAAKNPRREASEGMLLADRLRGCGLRADAEMATLIAARALATMGRLGESRNQIATVRRHGPAVSLEVTLLRRLAQSEVAQAEGRPGLARAELRKGLALLHARRGHLGSVDLQTSTAALGADLAAAGLRLALDRGSAVQVFAWLERSRAQAFQVRPVRPPADPRTAALLTELRYVGGLIRQAELAGQRDPACIARRAELQHQLRERSWQLGGMGSTTIRSGLSDVLTALAESGQTMISILVQDGRMLAIVAGNGRVRLVRLGDFQLAAEAARRLSADLDTLAGRRLVPRLEAVIKDSVQRQTRVLTAELIDPLRPWPGDGGTVLVPTTTLASIPWSLLPGLHDRPVTVAPSALSWLAAWRRSRSLPPGNGPPVLVAGPDLRHAPRELAAIAKLYPGCRLLLGRSATVDSTLRALDGAALAHLAAHGQHDRDNVLFSRLHLTDGPLMAYDIQALRAPPRQVVISACDVGRTVVRPGEELLGFTTALLYIGTATVISSVTRIADDAATDLMEAYHQALTTGSRPAEALAKAATGKTFSPFVCFGAG